MTYTARAIEQGDLEQIMAWRMDPDVTRWMNTDPKLTIDGQKAWLERINSDPSCIYWLLESDGVSVGVLSLTDIDLSAKTAEWGYYIGDKAARSMQLAVSVEMSLYAFCFEQMKLEVLYNKPLAGNSATVKLHELCGSRVVEIRKGAVVKNGISHDQVCMEIAANEWERVKCRKFERIELS